MNLDMNFIRSIIIKAIFDEQEARTRRAYELVPDSESEADDWSNCEEFEPLK